MPFHCRVNSISTVVRILLHPNRLNRKQLPQTFDCCAPGSRRSLTFSVSSNAIESSPKLKNRPGHRPQVPSGCMACIWPVKQGRNLFLAIRRQTYDISLQEPDPGADERTTVLAAWRAAVRAGLSATRRSRRNQTSTVSSCLLPSSLTGEAARSPAFGSAMLLKLHQSSS